MSKEENYSPEEEKKESILDFEEAKEMTVGQANRKKEELEAGVTDSDNVLDKYIKQHREEIEAGKFDTQTIKKVPEQDSRSAAASTSELAEFIKETREAVESSSAPENQEKAESPAADSDPEPLGSRSKRSEKLDDIPVASVTKTSYGPAPDPIDDEDLEVPALPFYKKKAVLYSVLGIVGLAAVGTTLYFALGRSLFGKGTTASSSSTSQSSRKSSSSSSSSDSSAQDVKAFNEAYAAFFTDGNQTAVKNSKFGDLEKLKALLEKLKGGKDYDAAKTKYDSLVKQISAIQSVNSQFDGGAITDGVLNKDAKANTNATFSDVSSGNAKLDEVLKAAIAQGRSQQTATPAPAADQGGTAAAANSGSAGADSGAVSNAASGYGISSNGVNLQRSLSRVPYNQAAIDDSSNPAWTFNPGVLEKILQTSRERGYISGDNYILERVNIIKGNGYYNLFKPDGTYLFSINCKTGYFVGNGPGYADSLDF
ncbi:cell division site-positioning protein MapZ family protein [Streptococcus panodentis]|uniref:Mid-cell-anchored protein Z n=1 Tax=Streptococcus panodentis TaxID=1581472 RepID=A0ABS5AW84_9STRE|nr:Holliday junction resolvase [Streptococcus panodentis]